MCFIFVIFVVFVVGLVKYWFSCCSSGAMKCAVFCVLLDTLGLLLWFAFEIVVVFLLLAIAVVVIYLLPVDAA